MSLLQQILSGRESRPPRINLYGTEGAGKSTTASKAPKPIFIQTEDGLGEIDCDKFPLAHSFDDVLAALSELNTVEHSYQTVVIDSLDWLERMIWDAVCKAHGTDSIEKVGGGYGKGYTEALPYWRKVIDGLDQLRNRKQMLVLLIAHAKVEKFEDPESAAYDRYSPRLHKHAAALICEWCDAVLFATRKITTQKENTGFGRTRTIAAGIGKDGGERVLRTVGGPACVAKNRYGLPAELPLSWPALFAALTKSPITQEGVKANGEPLRI